MWVDENDERLKQIEELRQQRLQRQALLEAQTQPAESVEAPRARRFLDTGRPRISRTTSQTDDSTEDSYIGSSSYRSRYGSRDQPGYGTGARPKLPVPQEVSMEGIFDDVFKEVFGKPLKRGNINPRRKMYGENETTADDEQETGYNRRDYTSYRRRKMRSDSSDSDDSTTYTRPATTYTRTGYSKSYTNGDNSSSTYQPGSSYSYRTGNVGHSGKYSHRNGTDGTSDNYSYGTGNRIGSNDFQYNSYGESEHSDGQGDLYYNQGENYVTYETTGDTIEGQQNVPGERSNGAEHTDEQKEEQVEDDYDDTADTLNFIQSLKGQGDFSSGGSFGYGFSHKRSANPVSLFSIPTVPPLKRSKATDAEPDNTNQYSDLPELIQPGESIMSVAQDINATFGVYRSPQESRHSYKPDSAAADVNSEQIESHEHKGFDFSDANLLQSGAGSPNRSSVTTNGHLHSPALNFGVTASLANGQSEDTSDNTVEVFTARSDSSSSSGSPIRRTPSRNRSFKRSRPGHHSPHSSHPTSPSPHSPKMPSEKSDLNNSAHSDMMSKGVKGEQSAEVDAPDGPSTDNLYVADSLYKAGSTEWVVIDPASQKPVSPQKQIDHMEQYFTGIKGGRPTAIGARQVLDGKNVSVDFGDVTLNSELDDSLEIKVVEVSKLEDESDISTGFNQSMEGSMSPKDKNVKSPKLDSSVQFQSSKSSTPKASSPPTSPAGSSDGKKGIMSRMKRMFHFGSDSPKDHGEMKVSAKHDTSIQDSASQGLGKGQEDNVDEINLSPRSDLSEKSLPDSKNLSPRSDLSEKSQPDLLSSTSSGENFETASEESDNQEREKNKERLQPRSLSVDERQRSPDVRTSSQTVTSRSYSVDAWSSPSQKKDSPRSSSTLTSEMRHQDHRSSKDLIKDLRELRKFVHETVSESDELHSKGGLISPTSPTRFKVLEMTTVSTMTDSKDFREFAVQTEVQTFCCPHCGKSSNSSAVLVQKKEISHSSSSSRSSSREMSPRERGFMRGTASSSQKTSEKRSPDSEKGASKSRSGSVTDELVKSAAKLSEAANRVPSVANKQTASSRYKAKSNSNSRSSSTERKNGTNKSAESNRKTTGKPLSVYRGASVEEKKADERSKTSKLENIGKSRSLDDVIEEKKPPVPPRTKHEKTGSSSNIDKSVSVFGKKEGNGKTEKAPEKVPEKVPEVSAGNKLKPVEAKKTFPTYASKVAEGAKKPVEVSIKPAVPKGRKQNGKTGTAFERQKKKETKDGDGDSPFTSISNNPFIKTDIQRRESSRVGTATDSGQIKESSKLKEDIMKASVTPSAKMKDGVEKGDEAKSSDFGKHHSSEETVQKEPAENDSTEWQPDNKAKLIESTIIESKTDSNVITELDKYDIVQDLLYNSKHKESDVPAEDATSLSSIELPRSEANQFGIGLQESAKDFHTSATSLTSLKSTSSSVSYSSYRGSPKHRIPNPGSIETDVDAAYIEYNLSMEVAKEGSNSRDGKPGNVDFVNFAEKACGNLLSSTDVDKLEFNGESDSDKNSTQTSGEVNLNGNVDVNYVNERKEEGKVDNPVSPPPRSGKSKKKGFFKGKGTSLGNGSVPQSNQPTAVPPTGSQGNQVTAAPSVVSHSKHAAPPPPTGNLGSQVAATPPSVSNGNQATAVTSAGIHGSKVQEELEGEEEVHQVRINLREWNPSKLLKELFKVTMMPDNVQDISSSFIGMEGLMEKLPMNKKKATLLKTWKRRFFRAKDGWMHYYETSNRDKPSDSLQLMGGRVEELGNRILGVDDGRGKYLMVRVPTDNEYGQWKVALESQTADNVKATYVRPVAVPNPHPKKNVIIIDIGSNGIRAGILGDQPSLPKIYFPSVVAVNNQTGEVTIGIDAYKPDVRKASTITYPVRPTNKVDKGRVLPFNIDMEVMPKIFNKVFRDLEVNPKQYWLMLSTPQNLGDKMKEGLMKILIDQFHVCGVCMVQQSLLALYSYSTNSGIIVDIGERMEILPIYDGLLIEGGVSRQAYGGKKVEDSLHICLLENKYKMTTPVEKLLVRYIMEQSCYVTEDYKDSMAKCNKDPESFRTTVYLSNYDLPDDAYLSVTLDDSCFKSPEGFFNTDLWGMDYPNLHKLIFQAIQACPMDSRKHMYRSIYLSGGVTLLPGFAERLQLELKKLAPPSVMVEVHASPQRYHSAYIGGCAVAGMEIFQDTCISAAEWRKIGVKAFKKWSTG